MMVILKRDCVFYSQLKSGLHTVSKGTTARILTKKDLRTILHETDGARVRSEFYRREKIGSRGAFAMLGGKWRYINEDAFQEV